MQAPVPCHATCPDCGYQLDSLVFRPAYHAVSTCRSRLLVKLTSFALVFLCAQIKQLWNPYVKSRDNQTSDLPGEAVLPPCLVQQCSHGALGLQPCRARTFDRATTACKSLRYVHGVCHCAFSHCVLCPLSWT